MGYTTAHDHSGGFTGQVLAHRPMEGLLASPCRPVHKRGTSRVPVVATSPMTKRQWKVKDSRGETLTGPWPTCCYIDTYMRRLGR
jgi:hypothetical protein